MKLEKKDKHTLFGDGKAHVVTDDNFIMALEEIDEREKVKEEGKKKWKKACVKAKEFKMNEKKAWEEALEEWKLKRDTWDEMCVQLKEDGCHWKDLLKAPKWPKKADVLVALGERDLEESGGSSEEEEVDVQVEEEEDEGTGDEGEGGDNDSEASAEWPQWAPKYLLLSVVVETKNLPDCMSDRDRWQIIDGVSLNGHDKGRVPRFWDPLKSWEVCFRWCSKYYYTYTGRRRRPGWSNPANILP